MKKNKLSLNELKVKSFTTVLDETKKANVKAGNEDEVCYEISVHVIEGLGCYASECITG